MAKSERPPSTLTKKSSDLSRSVNSSTKDASKKGKKSLQAAESVAVDSESQMEPSESATGNREGKRRGSQGKNPSIPSTLSPDPQLMERCKSAWNAFMPLVNRLPRDLVIADESLSSVLSNPLFVDYSEKNKLETSRVKQLATSELLGHLQNGLYHAPSSASKAKTKQAETFKRPLSPPRSKQQKPSKKVKTSSVNADGQSGAQHKGFSDGETTRLQLKQRLQDKLHAFKAKRKALLSAEETHEAHVLRGKLRKLKKKEKTREKKSQNHNRKKAALSGAGEGSQPGTATPSSQRSSSIVSEEGRLIFSRFDFFQPDDAAVHPKQPKGKNLTHLLNKAEADKRKLLQTETEDQEKGSELRQKKAWQEALLKAQGVKLKNDPDKLKKALKEQKKRKKRSERKWQERVGHVHKEQKERQDKRQKNLDKRKEAKQKKKRQKAIKKGHLIPGFN